MKRRFPARAWPIFGAIRYRAAVRCDECGHSLAGVPSGAPCSECGVVTPDARRTHPPVNVVAVVAECAWPMALVALGATLALGLTSRTHGSDKLFGALVAGSGFLLVTAATALTTVRLMRRMPRRARWAPVLLVVPRVVVFPVLAAAAATVVAVVLASGGAMAAAVGRSFLTP